MTFTEYIEKSFEGIQETPSLYKFKQQKIAEMSERANTLISSGLKDQNVLHSIIINENPDLKGEYKKLMAEKKKKAKKLKKSKTAVLGVVGYILALVIAFLFVSFVTNAWAKTWLIMVAGILLPIGVGCISVTKKGLNKQNSFTPVSRLTLIGGVFLIATVVFLCLTMLTSFQGTYLIYIAAVAFALIADGLFAYATKQKLAIITYLIYIPAIAALFYVLLGLIGILPWHPGWLIILLAIFADVAIILSKVSKGTKTEEEETDVWNED